jgi:fibronectin-binding autotransporter adhesin
VDEGIISLENNNALGAGGTTATVEADGTVEVNGGTNGLSTILTPITLNGLGYTNEGALDNTAGANFWYGPVTLGSSGTMISADAGTLEFDAGVSGTGDVNLFVGGTNGTVRIHAGGINLGNGTLTMNGTGSISINQSSAYTAVYSNLVVNSGTFLLGGQEANFGTIPASLLTNQITLNGGGIAISGTFTMNTNRGITVTTNGGSITVTSGALTVCGIYSPNANITINCNGGSATDFILGEPLNLGTGGYTKNGPETMNLNGKLNVCGKITINQGNLSWGTTEGYLGTVPATPTPDAITLNGGNLVPSNSQVVNANRGITFGTNGGSIGENTSSGTLTIAGIVSGPGNFTKLTGGSGSTVTLSANNTFTGNVLIQANNLRIGAGGTTGTLGSGSFVTNNGDLGFNRSDAVYTYGGTISGTGGVTNFGAGAITLTGANTYAAGTGINAGALFINNTAGSGTGSGNVNVLTKATLGGIGFIGGAVTVNAGGTISPGAAASSVGTLTINNNLTLAGNVNIAINKSLATTAGLITVAGSLINSGTGTLAVTNLGPALVSGDRFQIFSQPVSGGSALTVSGGGVMWNNNLAVDGSISVQPTGTQPKITNFSLSGSNLVLSGSNGTAGAGYYVLFTTNVAQPVSTWTRVLTNSFDGSGNFSVTNTISGPQGFYLLQLQ